MSNPKSWTNRLFIALVAVFDSYIVFNYLSLHPLAESASEQFFWIRMVMVSASLIGPILLLFVMIFPNSKLKIRVIYLLPIIFIGVSSAIASGLKLVFKSLEYVDGQALPMPGPGMPLFFLDFGLIIVSFFILISKYRKAQGIDKRGHLHLLVGIVTSFSLIGLFSLVFVVLLKSTTLVFLGPVFFLILIGSIAYAIVKYELFNIKIIATQLLVSVIWIILLSRVLVSGSYVEAAINILVLVLVVIFGVLLIQSIQKEVKQREVLEKLTRDLESANEKLKELDHIKSEFLSFASHQIKAPLASIKGFAALIYDGTYGQSPAKVIEAAHKISDAADRLVHLVIDFLNVRKIEEGKMEYRFEIINGVKLVKDIADELRPLAQSKNLEFSADINPEGIMINVDVQMARQAFQNLIENAIKYTETGFVRVKAGKDDGFFEFSVSDSGHGIAKEILPRLFEEFVREEKEKVREIEGTGLGLYIAKEIIEGQKGKIWAESEGLGKGSTFCIRLPLAG